MTNPKKQQLRKQPKKGITLRNLPYFLWDWSLDSDDEVVEEISLGDTQPLRLSQNITI
jgi:hypothetical protein